MQEVIVTNPEMSAGQKIGIVISFAICLAIVYAIFNLGRPRK